MNCFICHKSNWMQEKCLGFLRNLLENYKEDIKDDNVFLLLEHNRAEELLARLVREMFPKDIIKSMSEHRKNGFLLELDNDPAHVTLGGLWNAQETRYKVTTILPKLFENALSTPWGEDDTDVFYNKMLELQQTLKLNDQEINILLVSLAISERILRNPTRSKGFCGENFLHNMFMMTKCLNISENSVLNYISSDKPLRRLWCLDNDMDINGDLIAFLNGLTDEPLASSFFTKDTEETLPWNDFADLTKKHGSILKRMLTTSDKPVNILLYGAPGTGKTSFARTLVKEIGRTSYSITQNTHECGSRPTSSSDCRFGALQVCDGQVIPNESVIIVDEADDMLRGVDGLGGLFMYFGGGSQSHTGDKGLLNTVLDTIKTSTIWITNTPAEALDESSRRRFDYSSCFEPLNSEQRKRIWKNNIARLKMGRLISSRQLEEYSTLYPVSAGGISQTLENLERMHPRKSEIPRLVEQLMKPHCELLGLSDVSDDTMRPARDYSLDGLNIAGPLPLPRLVEAVRRFREEPEGGIDRPRMNILLSGAPGTGKTEFVKYLGAQLGAKVVVRMGSDLLNMYVGGTEKLIRRAFAQAEAEKAILFLDEIDGLVQSRERSQHSWEVTQVNELLHRMENFTGVMIGATNFSANLDAAILRRFTFKLEFDYLDEAGKKLFFERMFNTALTDTEAALLAGIPNLAPGDFRTVRQGLFYLGADVTNAERLEGLRRESAAKQANRFAAKGKMGF